MWRKKGEKAVLDLIIEHGQIVLETVKALHQYISVIRKKKPEKRLIEEEARLAEQVLELESNADRVEEKIVEELRRAVLPVTSSSRYQLVALIDDIADRSEITVRKLRIIIEPIPLDIKEKLIQMTAYCVEATTTVIKSIELLSKNFDAANIEARKVRPIRKQNRIVEFETLELLVKNEMLPFTLVLLHDVTKLLGRIGDRANEAADTVISMILKYRA